MRRLIILTDEISRFLLSISDFKNYTSMDTDKIRTYFLGNDYDVKVCKFSELDLNEDYRGVFILYQSSEGPGSFYKRYIEDLIYHLEKNGAIVLPGFELLRAHHDKIFMELLRSGFSDNTLKSVRSRYYGSWADALNYDSPFPVVIKRISSAGSEGVFLANNRNEYVKFIKKAGKIIVGHSMNEIFSGYIKRGVKKLLNFLQPARSRYLNYLSIPVSTSIVVQNFLKGLSGDYKVLIFGKKYYTLYRKNRENDFRASGSGRLYEVPEIEHEGLLNFAHKITKEINFPIFGVDVGFDGKEFHLLEFQVIHVGPATLQRSGFWHELHDGKWLRFEGASDLEQEFSRALDDHIKLMYKNQ